jgi:F-type H+-transporting ATPase subunit b
VLIDWFTVIAQILNFAILVALLKYFLYDRVIRAMDDRNQKIRARLEEADQKEKEAAEEKDFYLQKKRGIEEKEKELLSEAKQKAEAQRKELLGQAKEDVEALRKRWKESVEKEKDAFARDLRETTGEKVHALARKALKDLAETTLEEKTIEVFLNKIQEMKKEERERVMDAIGKSNHHLVVRSSFEASTRTRRKITTALREQFTKDLEVDYEEKAEMIFGIELKLQGQKIAWNLQGYLDAMEQEMRDSLESYTREDKASEQKNQAQDENQKDES